MIEILLYILVVYVAQIIVCVTYHVLGRTEIPSSFIGALKVLFLPYLLIAPIITHIQYKYWLRVRKSSEDDYGNKFCYCGHTPKCDCADPDKYLFKESLNRGTIKLFDKNNGWSTPRRSIRPLLTDQELFKNN